MRSNDDITIFNELFGTYYPRFIRYAQGYVKNHSTAEDLVSEAFEVYWEKRNELLPNTKPQAYILKIVRNKCINHLQRTKIKHQVEKKLTNHAEWLLRMKLNMLDSCNPEFIFSGEIQKILYETLDELPDKTRHIFELNRIDGIPYKEIADKMNLSLKSVEFHISKALRRLRFTLKDFISFLFFLTNSYFF